MKRWIAFFGLLVVLFSCIPQKERKDQPGKSSDVANMHMEFSEKNLRSLQFSFRVVLCLENAKENPYVVIGKEKIFKGVVGGMYYQTDWGRPDKKYLNFDTDVSIYRPLFYQFIFSGNGIEVSIISRDFYPVNEETMEKDAEENSIYRHYKGFVKKEDFLNVLLLQEKDWRSRGIESRLYVMRITSESKSPPTVGIVKNNSEMRVQPNEEGSSIATLRIGDYVNVLIRTRDKIFGKSDNMEYWYYIENSKKQRGWLPESSIISPLKR